MIFFTKQERQVLIFFALVIFIGTILKYFQRTLGGYPQGIKYLDEKNFSPKVDLNQLGLDDLAALPCVDPVLARRIYDLRAKKGCFRSLEELKSIPGMSRVVFDQVSTRLKISGECSAKGKM